MSATLGFVKDQDFVQTTQDMNVCNANACAILAALGMDTEFWDAPPCPIDEFERNCELFLTNPLRHIMDSGTKTVVNEATGQATMIECGRRPGYLTDHVQFALALTREAKALGATKVYFS